MHFFPLLSTLALLATAMAGPLPELEERAAPKKYHFQVQSRAGSKAFVGKYLTFSQYHESRSKVVFVPEADKPSEGNVFTVTNGSVHTTVPSNMVITSGLHSTKTVDFGDFVYFYPGKGSNDYFTIFHNRLSFKPQPMGSGDDNFYLCPVSTSPKLSALSLGAVGTGKGCEKIYVGAIPV